jgi:hypothetical protein
MQSHIWVIEVNWTGEWKPVLCFPTRKEARAEQKQNYTWEYSRIRKFIAA